MYRAGLLNGVDFDEIRNDYAYILKSDVSNFINSQESFILILNSNRRIVFPGTYFLNYLGVNSPFEVLGYRPGDILGCQNAELGHEGCGSYTNCEYCGAFGAIVSVTEKQKGLKNICLINTTDKGKTVAFDFLAKTSPFKLNDKNFVIFSLTDISEERKRRYLEKIFYHDIVNMASTQNGLLERTRFIKDQEKLNQYLNLSYDISNQILDEIVSHRDILAAEKKELAVNKQNFNLDDFLIKFCEQLSHLKIAVGKHVKYIENKSKLNIVTDDRLLGRIIINMGKNAIEASTEGEIVKLGYICNTDFVKIFVHNTSVIPNETKPMIFHRSFSTKAANRGWGTYSIKLLGENYLGGKVGFTSSPEKGTEFYINLPLNI